MHAYAARQSLKAANVAQSDMHLHTLRNPLKVGPERLQGVRAVESIG